MAVRYARSMFLSCLSLCALSPVLADERKPSPAMEASAPQTRERSLLAARTGRWAVTETIWSAAGAPPRVIRGGVAERTMVGDFLQETLREGNADTPVSRLDLLGYDRIEGHWDYVSMDTRAAVGLMPAWSFGRGDPDRIELRFAPFAMPGDGGAVPTGRMPGDTTVAPVGRLLRMEQTIVRDGADHEVKDQYFIVADGSGTRWLAHRYEYRRLR